MDPENKPEKYDAGHEIAVPRYSKEKYDAAMKSLKEQIEVAKMQLAAAKGKEPSDVDEKE